MPRQATVATSSATLNRRQVDHWFYIGVAVFMIVLNIAAFAPSLVDSSGRLGPLTPVVAMHGVVSFAFLLFFLIQTVLVATRRTAVHRRIGNVGFVLALAIVLLTPALSLETIRRGYDLSGDLVRLEPGVQSLSPEALRHVPQDWGANLAINASLAGGFMLLVGGAAWYRRRPAIHKRLMLLAMLGVMTGPPLAHLTGRWGAVAPALAQLPTTILLLATSAIHDLVTDRRIHPISIWVAVLLFLWVGLWMNVIAPSSWWQAVAVSLRQP
jgi:hypothetical protein